MPLSFIDLKRQRARIEKGLNERITRVLDHGQFIMGPEVSDLEQALSARAGGAAAITCSSGTDALAMIMMAWDVGPGDAIFVPAFTFPATAEVIALLGATPIFIDVDRETYNICPDSLERSLAMVQTSSDLTPKAVVVVDLFGRPAPYDQISIIAEKAEIKVLGDAAQSFGARSGHRPVGDLADATAISFFPAKPLGCFGDGGAIFTRDAAMAALLTSIRSHGRAENDKYAIDRIGLNARLDTVQAAVLLEKLTIFDDEIATRQRLANAYSEALKGSCDLPPADGEVQSAWAQYTVQVPSAKRKAIRDALAAQGIPTQIYYPRPMHHQKPYRHHPTDPNGLGTSEFLAESVLSLPMHPYLSPDEQAQVIDALMTALR